MCEHVPLGITRRWGHHSQEREGKESRVVTPCRGFSFGAELKYGRIRCEPCDRVFTAPENLNVALRGPVISHVCYEGACASNQKRKAFSTIRGLRTHYEKAHPDTPEEETSLGSSRSLKRKRDAEDKEDRRRRQDLEAQMACEAIMNREPELRPVSLIYRLQGRRLTYIIQVPLLERAIDAGLQRSVRIKRLPVRFRDSLPAPAPRAAAQSARLQKETEAALVQQSSRSKSTTRPWTRRLLYRFYTPLAHRHRDKP